MCAKVIEKLIVLKTRKFKSAKVTLCPWKLSLLLWKLSLWHLKV